MGLNSSMGHNSSRGFNYSKYGIYHCAFVRFSPSGSASASLSQSFGFTHDFFDIIAASIYHSVGIYILCTQQKDSSHTGLLYKKSGCITRMFLSSKSLSDFPIASFLRKPSLKIHSENFRKFIRIYTKEKFSKVALNWVNYTTLINWKCRDEKTYFSS